MLSDREVYNILVKEYGQPLRVTDLDLWQDVKAYGTYEAGKKDNQIWTMGGKLYRLCFAELSLLTQQDILEMNLY